MANIKDYVDLGEDIQDADKLPGTNDSDQTTTFNFSFTRIWTWIKTKLPQNITTVNVAAYTVLSSDNILHVLYTQTGAVTITVPTALITAGFTGKPIVDAGFNAGTNNITIVGEGGELVDGGASYIIDSNKGAANIYAKNNQIFVY